ncbi:MAG TPA: peptidoglycan-binding protein [Hyphomicrobium sp.]|nr:peptidoglycan-binding protein [Hyphomicrobium sp.]
MSARISRLATALFAVLSAAMAINLTVMQPGARVERVADRSGMWGAVRETAALAVPELDQRNERPELPVGAPAGAASRVGGPVPTSSGPLTPGIAQRVLVSPPEAADPTQTTRAVQMALAAKGYETGGTDGIAGPVTQAAILAYEVDNGLPLTAEPSDVLLAKIKDGRRGTATAASLAPGPKADALIRSVQVSLGKLGYKVGRADGRLGETTIAAIRAFEKQQAMPDTGRISGDLLTRLTRLSTTTPRTAERR